MQPCQKEKELDYLKECVQKNHDAVLTISKDVESICTNIKELKVDVKGARSEIKNLGANYIVFKTRVLTYWGLAVIVITTLLNKVIELI